MLKWRCREGNCPATTGSSACSSSLSLCSVPSSASTSGPTSPNSCAQQGEAEASQMSSNTTCPSTGEEEGDQQLLEKSMAATKQQSGHRPAVLPHRQLSSSSSSPPSMVPLQSSPLSSSAPPLPILLKQCSKALFPYGSPVKNSTSSAASEPFVAEQNHLRVYTGQIKPDMDYKTLRLPSDATTAEVIRQLVEEKLRLRIRDLNLFHLFMEVRSQRRVDGVQVRNLLELDANARPLELQRCHPEGMSRFILAMDSNAILARIHDSESNYTMLISRKTTCAQVLTLLTRQPKLDNAGQKPGKGTNPRMRQQLGIEAISEMRLFVCNQTGLDAQIPADCCLGPVCLSLLPGQKIMLRRVII